MTAKAVQVLLEDLRLLDGEQYTLLVLVRKLVMNAVSPFSEEVKYGGIIFSSGVQFCGVFAYKKHVSVEFSNGAKIPDALGHLVGSGKGRRHLKLYSVEDVEAKHVAYYLPLALEAAKAKA